MAACIMVIGTASNVGKSWIATGLCRLLTRRGLRVRPFKAQNMSNNAAVGRCRLPDGTEGWGELGRSTAAQAAASRVAAHVDMNPVLLKPTGPAGSQVVLLGEALGHHQVAAWQDRHGSLWETVTAAYDRVAADADVVILEGAGSPAELNLRDRDVVNMRMAGHAVGRARQAGRPGGCLLVGDISRGGVFAALKGTVDLLPAEERALIRGLVVNRFHGDPAHFHDGPALIEEVTGLPVRGVIPFRRDVHVDEEDGEDLQGRAGLLDVCILALPTVSNFTDVTSLSGLPGVGVRVVRRAEEVGTPDLLVLPGSKDTLADLAWLRETGLDRVVVAAARRQVPVLGLCGGYQLLGEEIADADGVGGTAAIAPGLGLLPVRTAFSRHKELREVRGRTRGGWLLPAGLPVHGYEIHQGRTPPGGTPLVSLAGGPDGAVQGTVAGTYLHGLLDSGPVRQALVATLRARRGLPPTDPGAHGEEHAAAWRDRQYDAAADVVEAHLDLSGMLP